MNFEVEIKGFAWKQLHAKILGQWPSLSFTSAKAVEEIHKVLNGLNLGLLLLTALWALIETISSPIGFK